MNDEQRIYIYGKHAVRDALAKRPDVLKAVYVREEMLSSEERGILSTRHIPVYPLNPVKLPRGVSPDAVHQGYVAEISVRSLVQSYDDFIQTCEVTNDTAFAVLGEVQDPHNVGAVIRSAAAFGIQAILIPEHRQAQISGTVIKVSVGAVFSIPIVQIANTNRTLIDLKKRGFWVYGLEGDGSQSLPDEQFEKPTVFVLGNEAGGIRAKTLEHCDVQLSIPLTSMVESLNASVAAGIAFYAWGRKHSTTAD